MGGAISKNRNYAVNYSSQFKKLTGFGALKGEVRLFFSKPERFTFAELMPHADYQRFEKSIVPTFHFQDSLPRLPIPELEKTCERYLRAQRPLLSDESYDETKNYVKEFMKGDGIVCQSTLIEEDKANKHTSYISKPWFDMYLGARTPLPINYNPALVFVKHVGPRFNIQSVKAANLIVASLRFYKSLREEILEPEVYHLTPESDTEFLKKFTGILPRSISYYGAAAFKAYPLDMSQYTNLFNTTRLPSYRAKDTIKHVDGKRHLLVMKGGNFYTVDVLDENGDIVAPDLIFGAVDKIVSSRETTPHPVGVLTTENRDVWATARTHLESIGNYEVLDLIDTALFNLVLDDDCPGSDPVKISRFFLHGDGTNRWFDKSFSLIVALDGTAGLNFEHSWGDGVAVLRYFNDVHKDFSSYPRVPYDTKGKDNPTLRKLEFKLDDKAKEMINVAQKKYKETCESLEIRVLDYRKCGRNMCNSLKISPDALMQLAFQIAHFQTTGGRFDTTYESCSTSGFKHGRTEAVRPCTIETKTMCKALYKINLPENHELQAMISQCSKVHSKLVKEAVMGQGFDRHLFALRLKAESLGLNPQVFADPAYAAINHNILSTSTLLSDNLQLGAFGPVVKNGYGIAYSIWGERLGCIVTNYKNQADGEDFIYALERALNKLNYILKP